ncbi:hypothetical protein TNCV_537201 [Trichonephila clavipes]|nr:hypothetical protein TNCV_537201 [Trichonephila clavipes]
MQVTVRFSSVPPQFRGRKPRGWSGASHLINHTRGLAARRLFRVPPCRKGTKYLQTSMSSPGFEPSPYGIAFSELTRQVRAASNLVPDAFDWPSEQNTDTKNMNIKWLNMWTIK